MNHLKSKIVKAFTYLGYIITIIPALENATNLPNLRIFEKYFHLIVHALHFNPPI